MFNFQPGRDRTGASLALFIARLHQPAQTTHQTVLKGLIYQLDAALERYTATGSGTQDLNQQIYCVSPKPRDMAQNSISRKARKNKKIINASFLNFTFHCFIFF